MRIAKCAFAVLSAAAAVGCNNFLSAEKAVHDPNNPTVASRNQLFVGVQANIYGQQEGPVALIACQWMQQCAAVGGRAFEQLGNYNSVNSGTYDIAFQSLYTAGGLIGIRAVEANAEADGDKVYKGVAEVLEVMNMLFGADVWGDIPYREATADNPTPKFDPQMQVYDDLLALLDKAIADLNGAGTGPALYDLTYKGDKSKWIEAAHTLKARIYLHRVEKLGQSEYAKALAEAKLGISKPQNNWLTAHTSAISERNMWVQVQVTSGFGSDFVGGAALINLMKAQSDPRLPEYFGKNRLGGYGGYDVSTGNTPTEELSPLAGSVRANTDAFPQPIITYDETQLIIAEASFQAGDKATATAALNRVRALYKKPAIDAPTLADIMNEKYIGLFQNYESWNDYKRTCLPTLKPARGKSVIPGRLLYGQTEEQTNPNTPASSAQPLFTYRNANDPNACQ